MDAGDQVNHRSKLTACVLMLRSTRHHPESYRDCFRPERSAFLQSGMKRALGGLTVHRAGISVEEIRHTLCGYLGEIRTLKAKKQAPGLLSR